MKDGLVTKLRLKPPSENLRRSMRESSLLGGRCAAAKTASKAAEAKTCFISPEQGFRRCLGDHGQLLLTSVSPSRRRWLALLPGPLRVCLSLNSSPRDRQTHRAVPA